MLINGGECGSIYLHPNQKWEVTFFFDKKNKVGLDRDNFSFIVEKDLFDELFILE